MKIVVAVVVYNRLKNIEEWIRTWKMCNTQDSELVVIHNFANDHDKLVYKELCEANNISYIPRINIGMDIGALQDVCKNRLEGFPEWDYLLWCTDDVIPMKKDFIPLYLEQMTSDTGVVCLEVSHEVKTHIRTTGFIISKELFKTIDFLADPIISKEQCYQFEHRNSKAFYEQVINSGKLVKQVVSDPKKSYLWDFHTRVKYNRWDEHEKEFPK